MSMAVTESTEASSSAVADDWETGEVQQEEQLKTKQQQIRLLKREKENREAAQREQLSIPMGAPAPPAIIAAPADAKPIPVAPRKLLRRPASGPNMPAAAAAATVTNEVSPTADPGSVETATGAEIPVDEEEKFKNLEKRKAVYDATRARILGSDYKPEEVKAPAVTSCRSRSPEIELKQRTSMGGGVPPPVGPPPQLSMIPPVNFSEPPPPLPPAHMMAAYQAHLIMTQQQQQYYGQQPTYAPMGLQQMSQPPVTTTTSSNEGYRDLFDTPPMYSMPPPTGSMRGGNVSRPPPLSSMSLLASALPPPSSNGIMYSTPPPAIGIYGRPPQSMFQTQNPDITFRHESARGGRRRKN